MLADYIRNVLNQIVQGTLRLESRLNRYHRFFQVKRCAPPPSGGGAVEPKLYVVVVLATG
jgi:hypothetical protein